MKSILGSVWAAACGFWVVWATPGCAPAPVASSGRAAPLSLADAEAAVTARFDLKRYFTTEFIPVPGAAAPEALTPPRPLRLGLNWVGNDQFAPWFVGREKGFFRDVGIDLQIVEGGPGRDHLHTLLAGHIEVYTGFPEPLFQMLTSPTGSPLMMVAANTKNTPLGWMGLDKTIPQGQRSTKVFTAEDLRGKTFGVQPGGDFYLNYALGKVGLGLGDVKLVNAGASPDALIGGAMDFYQSWTDNQPRVMERSGYYNWAVFAFRDVGYRAYGDISVVTPEFYAANKELLRRYVHALDRSLRFLIAEPDEAARLVAATKEVSSFGLTEAEVRWRIGQDIPLYLGDGSQALLALDFGQLQEIAVEMHRYHFLTLPPTSVAGGAKP